MMPRYLVIGLWVFALSFGIAMALFWWVAAFNDWQVTLNFAQYGEHWFEGVLFHFAILVALLVGAELVKGKRGQKPGKGQFTTDPREEVSVQLRSEANS